MTDQHAAAAMPSTPTTLDPLLPRGAAPGVWREQAVYWLLLIAVLGLVPLVAADNNYRLAQFAKYLALAILALGVDLVWGYTGMLSLGQGLYFGLGAYSVAYSLEMQKVAAVARAIPGTIPPGFMEYTNLPITHPDYQPPWALPFIAPLANIWVALAAAVILPVIAATLFGLMTFRLRIRGVYFALITQALLLAAYTLVLNQQSLTGGFVGIKNLADLNLFGMAFNDSKQALPLYLLVAGTLVVCLVACSLLTHSKVGKILTAIRDNENRTMALGYNPAAYKVFIFAVAACLAGIGGAMYTAANGLAGPEYLSVAFSIDLVVLVAVGGRGTLFGAVFGALLVGLAKDHISERSAELWPIFLGCLYVGVVLLLPQGILGALRQLAGRFRRGTKVASA